MGLSCEWGRAGAAISTPLTLNGTRANTKTLALSRGDRAQEEPCGRKRSTRENNLFHCSFYRFMPLCHLIWSRLLHTCPNCSGAPLSRPKRVPGLIAPWSQRGSERRTRRAIHFSIWFPAWDKLTDVDWFSFPYNCEPCLQLTARAMYLSGCLKGTHIIIRLSVMRQLAGDLVGTYFDMFYFSCLLVKLIDSSLCERPAADGGVTKPVS